MIELTAYSCFSYNTLHGDRNGGHGFLECSVNQCVQARRSGKPNVNAEVKQVCREKRCDPNGILKQCNFEVVQV